MSSLQESVEARRAAQPAEQTCAVVGVPGPALTICPWKERSWVFPWSHLMAASLTESESHDTLELSFTGHVVTVTGHNLRRVRDDLAGFRLISLCALPAEYRSRLSTDAGFAATITVRPTAETRESP